MKKTNISIQTGTFRENIMNTSLRITRCQFWPIGNLWAARKERNWFWRYYYNESLGAGIIYNDQKIELLPDKFYLIPPGTPFKTFQYQPNIRQFYITFDTMLMTNQVNENIYTFELTGPLKSMMYEIDNLFKLNTTDLPPHIQTLCVGICGLALSQIPSEDFIAKDIPAEIVHASHQLKVNMTKDISVEQLASDVSMAPNSLIRLFKKHLGITPYQYLTDLRMERATQLLGDSDIPIETIALKVGYKDRFHFSRLFKKKTGSNPGAYRKNRHR